MCLSHRFSNLSSRLNIQATGHHLRHPFWTKSDFGQLYGMAFPQMSLPTPKALDPCSHGPKQSDAFNFRDQVNCKRPQVALQSPIVELDLSSNATGTRSGTRRNATSLDVSVKTKPEDPDKLKRGLRSASQSLHPTAFPAQDKQHSRDRG